MTFLAYRVRQIALIAILIIGYSCSAFAVNVPISLFPIEDYNQNADH